MKSSLKNEIKGKILFISHAASRTGAPILLLQFLKWLKANSNIEFNILVSVPGPLLPEFETLAETYVMNQPLGIPERVFRKLIGRSRWIRIKDQRLKRWCHQNNCMIVHANTIVPQREMEILGRAGYPIICHVHELDYAIHATIGYDVFRNGISFIKHFIAGSNGVRDYLTSRWQISPSKVSTVHEFTLPLKEPLSEARESVRVKLGLEDGNILVGACGTLNWRKGADLFIQIARLVRLNPAGNKIRFLWVGAEKTHAEYGQFIHDLNICQLGDVVSVVDLCSNHLDYLSAMDIFALTSREDPFPLVMLEAASLSLPLICFESSGGGPEFTQNNAGLIAPYLDVSTFAQHIISLANDKETRLQLGAAGAEGVRKQYDIEVQAPKLLDIITGFMVRNGEPLK